MLEKIITLSIVVCCAFFIGRKFYRQWRNAALGNVTSCCTDGCSSCNAGATCDIKTVNNKNP